MFLDRDGVINEPAFDDADGAWESPYRPERAELIDGAAQAMQALHEHGYLLVVVSNQPGVAKGKASHSDLQAVHDRIESQLADAGVAVDAYRYCYHHPHAIDSDLRLECDCRKPQPGMLLTAASELGIGLQESWMVGDADRDIQAGHAAGCKTVLVEHPSSKHRRSAHAEPDLTARNLAQAAGLIVGESSR